MNDVESVKRDLEQHADPEKAVILTRFFQAVPGGYGEGDRFMGVKVPDQRKIARKYFRQVSLQETEILLQDAYHECRLTALFILCLQYEKGSEVSQEEIVQLYLQNLSRVNNWDLVDSSADKILGPYLINQDKDILFTLAESGDLWKQRVAVMTTFYFIKKGRFDETLNLAKCFLNHEHDLIHKAVGWMLREIGNRDAQVAYDFLSQHYRDMPRTMLRYAIEKFDPQLRQKFLKGEL